MDAALLLALESLVAGVTLVLPTGDWRVARNVLILAGLSAIGAALISPAAGASTVTVFVLFVVTCGASAPGSRFVRVLQAPPTAIWPLLLALALTAAAALVLSLAPPSGGHDVL